MVKHQHQQMILIRLCQQSRPHQGRALQVERPPGFRGGPLHHPRLRIRFVAEIDSPDEEWSITGFLARLAGNSFDAGT
jgi:hypothetical protein